MAWPTSRGSPRRPIGCWASIWVTYRRPDVLLRISSIASVLIVPGATAFTRIPRLAHSTARCLVSPVATNFAGPYAAWPACPASPLIEDRVTMHPLPCSAITQIGRAAGEEHAAAVDRHDVVPVLDRRLVDGAERDHAGVGHQAVQPVPRPGRRLDHRLGIGLHRDISDDHDEPVRAAARRGDRPAQRIAVDVGRHDPGALLEEDFERRSPIRRRPRHHCDLVVQDSHDG